MRLPGVYRTVPQDDQGECDRQRKETDVPEDMNSMSGLTPHVHMIVIPT